MNDTRWFCFTLSFLAASLALAGCSSGGPPTYDFKGTVTYKGASLVLKGMGEAKAGGGVQVWLIKQDAADKTRKQAIVSQDGSFVFAEGNKPTAGKYQICVKWQDNYPLGADRLKGKFDEKNSKHFCTIPDDKEIDIDVAK